MSFSNQENKTAAFNLVTWSLKKPATLFSAVVAVILVTFIGLNKISKDILPSVGTPTIYVAQPFGGMTASQMESYVTYYYEYHFLYIAGIARVESKNIASTALIKLEFYPGTDMAQAAAETIGYVNRARAFMPEGLVSPFIMRFDSGGLPVGKLVFSTENPERKVTQMQTLALNSVRPLFATLPGVSAPPPFGGSQRSILINLDPEKLNKYQVSPADIASALAKTNKVYPSGNLLSEGQYPVVTLNSGIKEFKELEGVPIRVGTTPTILIKDVASVQDGADIQTGTAIVNGRRTVYIPVTKRSNASTLTVVNLVKENLNKFQSVLPDDVKVTYEFDQSVHVVSAIRSLIFEIIAGALLASLMIFLFLKDVRSAIVVFVNIPLSMSLAMIANWIFGQTINTMTLGGLALSVGLIVDEVTVVIENTFSHLEKGKSVFEAVIMGSNEVLRPAFLTVLCILAMLIPSFFMEGVSRSLFLPLSLSVGFCILSSFILSRTLVPLLLSLLLTPKAQVSEWRLRSFYKNVLDGAFARKNLLITVYLFLFAIAGFLSTKHGAEIFPQVDNRQMQLRIRAPSGTALVETEKITNQVIASIKNNLGEKNVIDVLSFVGMQPPSYPINTIHQWSSGTHEAVIEIDLSNDFKEPLEKTKEKIRDILKKDFKNLSFNFEISSMVEKILSQGNLTPIEIYFGGKDLTLAKDYAAKIKNELEKLDFIRDVHFAQAENSPGHKISIDRVRAGAVGVTATDVANSVVPATSSSRFTTPSYWSDPKSGVNFQVQVQIPQGLYKNAQHLSLLPVSVGGGVIPLKDVAEIQDSSEVMELNRLNMQRYISLRANLHDIDLKSAGEKLQKVLSSNESQKPKDISVKLLGQWPTLQDMFSQMTIGLGIALLALFLLLTASFESTRKSLTVLSVVPGTLTGVVFTLSATGMTWNMESFIGTIMAMGVSLANAILLTQFIEREDRANSIIQMQDAAIRGAMGRLRPILITAFSMIFGMVPMALGLGGAGDATRSLATAVIGGLLFTTISTLLVLPLIYSSLNLKGQKP